MIARTFNNTPTIETKSRTLVREGLSDRFYLVLASPRDITVYLSLEARSAGDIQNNLRHFWVRGRVI